MTTFQLMYMSESKLTEVRGNILANQERYRSGDFVDLSRDNGWNIPSDLVSVKSNLLSSLPAVSATADTDANSSVIVYESLVGMTPALAMEARVWTRLAHIECLNYSRARWSLSGTEEYFTQQVLRHFFALGRTGIRDDNSVSRLWWNMHIAKIADPADPEGALRIILKSADIRQAIVERPNTAARKPLIKALLRAMRANQWITSTEKSFRRFMVELNVEGGGRLFEVHSDVEVDRVMHLCAEKAQKYLEST